MWYDPYGEYDTSEVSCCKDLAKTLSNTRPDQHANENPTLTIGYSPFFREFGLVLRDAIIEQLVLITYCPFCGSKLPEPQRERWFSELEDLGYDPVSVSYTHLTLPTTPYV